MRTRWLIVLAATVIAAGLPVATDETSAAVEGDLLFVTARDGNFEIYRSTATGAGLVNLTRKRLADDLDPAWAPQGNRIAFARDGIRRPNPDLWVMNADGSGQTRLTGGPTADRYPAWSPTGEWIAFVRSFPPLGTSQIMLVSPDGERLRRLTGTGAGIVNGAPAWSPDGLRLAFTSDRDGGFPEIFVMNADGSGVGRLTKDDRIDGQPAWSPDGARIAFERYGGGDSDLWVMNADGTAQQNVTRSPADESAPSWSADGLRLAYVAAPEGGGDRDLFTVDPSGGARTRVTMDPRADLSPDWGPADTAGGAAATAVRRGDVGAPVDAVLAGDSTTSFDREAEQRRTKKKKRRVVRQVAPGVKLIKIRRKGPSKVFALRVDPTRRPSIDVALARGVLPGLQRTRRIARRHRALAAVNGDFALPGGRPAGVFAADADLKQSSFMGGPLFASSRGGRSTRIADPRLSVTSLETGSGDVWRVHRWNNGPPVFGEVAGYSPAGSSLELPPSASCAARLLPQGGSRLGAGRVERDYEVDVTGCFASRLARGKSVVLAALPGSPESMLLRSLQPGERLTLSWSVGWPGPVDGIGGYPRLVRDGRLAVGACGESLCDRHPRTGLGITKDGQILLVVVDGRQPRWSVGVTLVQFAREMRRLGAVQAMNLDGGGSSTMVVRGRIINRPSGGNERSVSSAVLVLRAGDRGEPRTVKASSRSLRAATSRANPALLDPGSTGGLLDALAEGTFGPRVALPDGLLRVLRAFRLDR